MDIKPYIRHINYYETDQMGIVHHSNYIRYFEEARIYFMHYIGCDVGDMEKLGLIIPNVDAYARYLKTLKFNDVVNINVKLTKFNGSRMHFEYIVTSANTEVVTTTGFTTHCFVNKELKPVSIKHTFPQLYDRMKNAVSE